MKADYINNIGKKVNLKNSYINFGNIRQVEQLTNVNIGNCLEGFIGKIKVRRSDNTEAFLNLFKKYLREGYENYSLKNETGDVIGEIILVAKKYIDYDKFQNSGNPSHIFVSELRNYSNPNTPYLKQGLEYYKDIGLRLMQIAQKRSDEAMCNGNIKLIAKNESKEWYKNIIGMTEEFPPILNNGLKFCVNNPNAMILPQYSKEKLMYQHGGLQIF